MGLVRQAQRNAIANPPPFAAVRAIARMWRTYPGAVRKGQKARDFTLPYLPGRAGMVKLSHHFGQKPVGLVFGNYSCPPFRGHVDALNEIYRAFSDRVAFYLIYMEEAHPTDGWHVTENEIERVLYKQPISLEERTAIGQACVNRLGIEIPALVDKMDNRVATNYAGMPQRLYLVGVDGTVVYKGRMGPFFFRPDEWRQAIDDYLHGTLSLRISPA